MFPLLNALIIPAILMFLILTAPAVFGDLTIIRVNQAAAKIGRFFVRLYV